MSLVAPAFLAALAALLIALRLVPKVWMRRVLLLVAGYAVYAAWDLRFLWLALLLPLANWAWVRLMVRDERYRKVALVGAVVTDLGVLGAFKYFDFFLSSLVRAIPQLETSVTLLGLLLPLGISFFTFEMIAYAHSVYRGDMEPASPVRLMTMTAFFPRLIAGPFLVPKDFLEQLDTLERPQAHRVYSAVLIFSLGLAKKVLIADQLGRFVDTVFAHPGTYGSATIWVAALAFTLQLFFDFSGYSDMALAIARAIGIDVTNNFDLPYLSRNIADFWNRWHISLARWFRVNLYFPLGGNRKGLARTCVNLVIVMVLCGLWHGAAWTFVVWGFMHGAALAMHRLWVAFRGKERDMWGWPVVASWVLTMLFVVVGWVVFRAASLSIAAQMLARMFVPTSGFTWVPTQLLWAAPLAVAWYAFEYFRGPLPVPRMSTFSESFAFWAVVIAVAVIPSAAISPFIYAKF